MYEQAEDFFNLPVETKMRIANEKGPWPQRGFSWAGAEQTSKLRKENLVGESWEDLKDARVGDRISAFIWLGSHAIAQEHFDAGPPSDKEYPNRWPSEEELPG